MSTKLPVSPAVQDILLWTDVKRSAVLFGGATAAFLFLQYGSYSFLSLIAYGLSAAVFAMMFWNIVGRKINKPPPALPPIITNGIPEAQLRSYADKAGPIINKALSAANTALNGSNPGFSLAAAGGLFMVGRVAAVVPFLAMLYLPVLAAFTLPKVYELKKEEIDAGLTAGREKATALYDKALAPVLAKIPRAAGPSPAESSSMRKMD